MSTWPAEYCSMTSLTSYGFSASLNLRLATKYLILRRALIASLCVSVSCVTVSGGSSAASSPEKTPRTITFWRGLIKTKISTYLSLIRPNGRTAKESTCLNREVPTCWPTVCLNRGREPKKLEIAALSFWKIGCDPIFSDTVTDCLIASRAGQHSRGWPKWNNFENNGKITRCPMHGHKELIC